MFNDLPSEFRIEEIERNAYNAAFYELGLRWHWDSETWAALRQHSTEPAERIGHYLRHCQPHLLTAYDADFLARAIHEAMLRHKGCATPRCDWSKVVGCELGI